MIRKQPYKRSVVVVDIDGVVADWYFSASPIMKKLFGKPEWPVSNYQAPSWGFGWCGITDEQEDVFWDYIHESKEPFWQNEREAIPGCVKQFYQVAKDTTFYWCTTRDDQYCSAAKSQTENFLEWNGFYNPTVICSDRKEDFCFSVKADFFVDDKFSNCRKVAEKNPETKVLWLLMPYQLEFLEEAKKYSNITVCKTLDEVYNLITAEKNYIFPEPQHIA